MLFMSPTSSVKALKSKGGHTSWHTSRSKFNTITAYLIAEPYLLPQEFSHASCGRMPG